MLQDVFTLAVVAAIVVGGLLLWAATQRRKRIQDRLKGEHRVQFEEVTPLPDEEMSWLRRWLFVAGFRRPDAPAVFLSAAVTAALVGFGAAIFVRALPVTDMAVKWLYDLPGGIGAIFAPVLLSIPWLLAIIILSLPWLYVRAARRRRVQEIEEDLPITLQILATLARAGLGFDASLTRVLESADVTRTLADELHNFRRENLSGLPRAQCWKRLARRVEVPSVSTFVSAMVHSEQVGGGLSGVLEHQTEDAQSRRREAALIQAYALPVKLVFPLVICFLPGIFVWTLGPAFYQFLKVLDTVMRKGG